MKKFVSLCAIAALMLDLTSCFEYKGVVTVNKDGSATLEEAALMSAQMKAVMAGTPGGDNPEVGGNSLLVDKERAAERAKTLGEGVTVKSHEEITLPDGKTGVKVVYAIADINKLKFLPAGKREDPSDQSKCTTFAFEGTTLTITNPDKKSDPSAAPGPKQSKEVKRAGLPFLKNLLTGARFAFEVKAPGGIASTDATFVDGDTIAMVDVDFDKLGKNDDHLMDFMDSIESGMSFAQVGTKFKEVDGAKIESKEVIKAVLK